MKKLFIPFVAMALISFSSCKSSQNTGATTNINGEWNIVEVNGSALNNIDPHPYIGFDTANGRVYGNSGCNRIMSSLTLNEKAGDIELGQMATTMMAGPNMDVERNVLNALALVKNYKKMGKDKIALCNESKRPVIVLEKRFYTISAAELNGEWEIVKVYNENIPTTIETIPYLSFDVEKQTFSGNASCNTINGKMQFADTLEGQTITFENVISTRMMCPSMDIENNIINALKAVKTCGKLENGNLALYANGNQIMELKKK